MQKTRKKHRRTFQKKARNFPKEINLQYFKLWLRDNQVRPCFGTTEKKALPSRKTPADLGATGGTKARILEILKYLKKAKIPLDEGVMTYNTTNKSIQEFHLKHAMSPEAYTEKFLLLENFTSVKFRPTHAECEEMKTWYSEEYYGDKLRILKENENAKITDDLVHAATYKDVIDTGSVVLCNTAPVQWQNLEDNVIVKFEETVRKAVPDNKWFAVCFYVKADVDNLNEAELIIGAKIEEKQFILKFQPFSQKVNETVVNFAENNPESDKFPEVCAFFKRYKYVKRHKERWMKYLPKTW